MSAESKDKAEKFLAIASQFKLGSLVTEASHPMTRDLSYLAADNLPGAIEVLFDLDRHTIDVMVSKFPEICYLKERIKETLKAGNNIFFCGCGATGRLSLTIETLWRQENKSGSLNDRVFSFMAGGDVALIRSIENFEDFPQYGARQLIEAGYKDGDLLIGTTEGGETPFVIGAVEKAAEISFRKPFFIYCNPDDVLCNAAERSKKVIENTSIEKINLTVGPMAVTGSTRMQSSTILLGACGSALFYYAEDVKTFRKSLEQFAEYLKTANFSFIEKFVLAESELYKNGDYLLYETDNKLGITVITDTTERSPTFSLLPFENSNEPEQAISLCYLCLSDYEKSEEAWNKLLWRSPRTLEWPEINGIASRERLLGFDFSVEVAENREKRKKSGEQNLFKIFLNRQSIDFILNKESYKLKTPFKCPIFTHLVLKMILNIHSTLIMGRLGRYEGNVMTYVRASNNKLIDRSIRYIDMILKSKNISISYNDLCYLLFEMLEVTQADKSIVLATVTEAERRNKIN
jgi:N-acetylmuramic acid 6-phosphate etherase